MQFFATAAALFSALMLVAAVDDRVLVKFNDAKGGNDYCKQWKCACINYEPKDTSLYFQAAYCQPGDFQGNNAANTARVFCTFTDGKNPKSINKHTAAATGGTLQ